MNSPTPMPPEKRPSIKGFIEDIEGFTLGNDYFRRVLYTAKHCQLVVMSLRPGESIGEETHSLDQFLRVEAGTGDAVLDGIRTPVHAGIAVLVPAGVRHDLINTGSTPLKLHTLYAPPNHCDGVVHRTRADAETHDPAFNGATTE